MRTGNIRTGLFVACLVLSLLAQGCTLIGYNAGKWRDREAGDAVYYNRTTDRQWFFSQMELEDFIMVEFLRGEVHTGQVSTIQGDSVITLASGINRRTYVHWKDVASAELIKSSRRCRMIGLYTGLVIDLGILLGNYAYVQSRAHRDHPME